MVKYDITGQRGKRMETLKIGSVQLTWLSGGVTNLDGGAMFGVVPKALWAKKYPPNEKNLIELPTEPILIQMDGKNIIGGSRTWKRKIIGKTTSKLWCYCRIRRRRFLKAIRVGS